MKTFKETQKELNQTLSVKAMQKGKERSTCEHDGKTRKEPFGDAVHEFCQKCGKFLRASDPITEKPLSNY